MVVAARDVGLIMVLLFAVALIGFVVYYVGGIMADAMLTNNEINQTAEVRSVFTSMKNSLDRIDQIFMAFFIGFILFLLISGYFIGGHPIWMIIYFIVVVIVVVVAAVLANVWEQVTTASTFGNTILQIPLTNHVISNFALYMAIIGLLGIFVMFVKPVMQQNE